MHNPDGATRGSCDLGEAIVKLIDVEGFEFAKDKKATMGFDFKFVEFWL